MKFGKWSGGGKILVVVSESIVVDAAVMILLKGETPNRLTR